jgi:DNA polymerase-3 subunit chi
MTRIDFYLLSSDQPDTRLAYACRLAQKAWHKGHRVYLHCPDEAITRQVDDLLWSFRRDAFVPHVVLGEGPEEPVACGSADQPGSYNDLLINLSDQPPAFFSRFQRMAEIVIEHDPVRLPARDRFRLYRERGYPLNSHPIRTAG